MKLRTLAIALWLLGFVAGWGFCMASHRAFTPIPSPPLRISMPVIRENRALLKPNRLEYRPEGKVVWL